MSEEVNYWTIIEPIWYEVDIYSSPEVFLKQFEQLTEAQKALFPAHWLYSEVCNGGFHQFFINPTGILAPEAVLGYVAIGLNDCAELIKEAISFFGELYPREREKRQEILYSIPGETREEYDPFYKLDEQFYKCTGTNSMDSEYRFEMMADEYARKHLNK